ncbi:Myo-inositol 2-dehydrogenase 1 [Cronobacter sakazakii 696]|nr:Myo-inositol 2-dehydrogenase 1 [Cronobacter sakazakii 696]
MVFNGSRGRLEMKLVENSYVNGGGLREAEGSLDRCDITVYPMFAAPWKADFTLGEGGHGGGDNAMLADLFGEPGDDPQASRRRSPCGRDVHSHRHCREYLDAAAAAGEF